MELSIIITSFRNPELLKVCLDSIKKNCSLENYEIIVADSETQEKTEMMMREEYPEIKFFPSRENTGFQFLVKTGYTASSGEYILILNGDIIVKKNSVEKLLTYIKSDTKIGIAGPKLLNFNETLQYSCFRYYTPLTILYRRTFLGKLPQAKKHLGRFLMKEFDHNSPREVDWVMGSAMMTRRQAVDKVGPMDEKFKMYFEDTDWCRRFWENGYKVMYYPESEMYHYHGKGSANKNAIISLFTNRLSWIHITSAVKYFIKYFGKEIPVHN
jgi:GT2 family glycosyltransferase